MNFLPDFTHVSFLPLAIAVVPAFEHVAPGLGVAALAGWFSPTDIKASKVDEMAIDRSITNTPAD